MPNRIQALEPERTRTVEATPSVGRPALTEQAIQSWRERGFCLVSGVFEPELIAELTQFARATYPAPNTPAAEAITDFGSVGKAHFPSSCAALNQLTLHPRLLEAVGQLLGVPLSELRLTQSDLWPKYGRTTRPSNPLDNDDQRIHVDYPNHTLTHPPGWERPEAVELIVYYSDARECDGRTALVPREGPSDPAYRWPIVDSPGIGDIPFINDRTTAEEHLAKHRPEASRWRQALYAREVQADYRAGDTLFYRHDTWHRGTPLRPGARRFAQNLTYRLASAEWISTLHIGWAWVAYTRGQTFERLIAHCSPDQRTVLGFPPPGSAYWSDETIAAVEARYGAFGMDLTPYRAALEAARRTQGTGRE